ncbi:MAG TPA: 4-hydroxybutyrate CoA transferase [Dehalococcoidia bacterium]|nr:4-hydroxybutyrate CoA transferase [Dehalococcoidia bacterium]
MGDWREEYKRKLISAEDAAKLVKSGDRVAFTSGREALAIGLALAARKEELKNVQILAPTPTYDFGWYDEGWQDSFNVIVRMPTGVCQEAMDARRIDFEPGTLIPFIDVSDTDLEMPEMADVVITEVSPPDEKGFCSFGASLWAKKRQLKNAKLRLAEVNQNLIRTFGDNYIHISEIDYFVEHVSSGRPMGAGSLAGRELREPEPYLRTIAEICSTLIRDGDTLQIGVGRTTEQLVRLGLLDGKSDIGWHSEATPPGVITLVCEGVINGSRKTINQYKAVVTSLGGGSREEMTWASNNPLFWLMDVAYLEDPRVIGAHDNFVAINNALMVDLTGQIAAETVGTRQIAAAGGQIPFVLGSWLSKGGRSITVLPSTYKARDGSLSSRIVPTLPAGTVVTIQRNCADYVVTEYGVAHLKGRTLRGRAAQLIAIAHPDFRSELKKEATRLFHP